MGFKLLLCIVVTLFQNDTKLLSGVSDRFVLFSSVTRDPTKKALNWTAKFFIVLNNYFNYQSLKGNPSPFFVFFFESKVEKSLELDCLRDFDR